MFGRCVLLGLYLAGPPLLAQQGARVDLGRLQTGATVAFVRTAEGGWGIEIAGAATPLIRQPKPTKLEVYRAEEDIRQLAAGYRTLEEWPSGIDAPAELKYGENVIFRVQDRWSLIGAVASVRRKVEVMGNAPGGFNSSLVLAVDPSVKIRAAEYVWTHWEARGLFIGGASDNPNITDKEAGMLSMEAFLSLYDSTKEPKRLERAQAAADFTESWIWIWNLPMPLDADDAQLHWKKGVPTVGVQGITARVAGGADEYLDWAVPSYAKLYNLTKDPHYLDVARILLHDTKSMVALSGRQYDLKGIGW
jgi:hypothetical protein